MLSESGIWVFVLGNMGLGWSRWENVYVSDEGVAGGAGCGGDQGWWCVLLYIMA